MLNIRTIVLRDTMTFKSPTATDITSNWGNFYYTSYIRDLKIILFKNYTLHIPGTTAFVIFSIDKMSYQRCGEKMAFVVVALRISSTIKLQAGKYSITKFWNVSTSAKLNGCGYDCERCVIQIS